MLVMKTFSVSVILSGAGSSHLLMFFFQFTVKLHGIPVYGDRGKDSFEINIFQLVIPEKLKERIHLAVGKILHNQHFLAEIFAHREPGTGSKSRYFKKIAQRMKQLGSRYLTDIDSGSSQVSPDLSGTLILRKMVEKDLRSGGRWPAYCGSVHVIKIKCVHKNTSWYRNNIVRNDC